MRLLHSQGTGVFIDELTRDHRISDLEGREWNYQQRENLCKVKHLLKRCHCNIFRVAKCSLSTLYNFYELFGEVRSTNVSLELTKVMNSVGSVVEVRKIGCDHTDLL